MKHKKHATHGISEVHSAPFGPCDKRDEEEWRRRRGGEEEEEGFLLNTVDSGCDQCVHRLRSLAVLWGRTNVSF